LHRAEGFGRTLAEALLLNKPVIATGYSGNVDFMRKIIPIEVDFDLVDVPLNAYQWCEPGVAKWAEVKLSSAAEKMLLVSRQKYLKIINSKNLNLLSPSYVSQILINELS
jgi:glycosyltransferase involved in cell wall biosynthesis